MSPSSITVIIGNQGSGKTTKAMNIIGKQIYRETSAKRLKRELVYLYVDPEDVKFMLLDVQLKDLGFVLDIASKENEIKFVIACNCKASDDEQIQQLKDRYRFTLVDTRKEVSHVSK